MKILFGITRSDTMGGAQSHVADLAAWLQARGHQPTVILGGRGPYCAHLDQLGVPWLCNRFLLRQVKPWTDARAVHELRGLFRAQAPDLIALHSAKAGIIGRIAASGLGIPVTFTAHGWSFTMGVSDRRARLYWFLEKAMVPLTHRIIAVSEHDRMVALQKGLCAPETIVTIHNGIPGSTLQADPGAHGGEVRIISVARLEAPKDHRTLLLALAKLRHRSWTLDLVGDGPLENEIRTHAATLDLARRVRFLGLRDDVPLLLAHAHLFVLASRSEGFPLSILEAMRAGLPVVASAIGGIPEAVVQNSTGYLLQTNDINALAEKLDYMIMTPQERVRMGLAARSRFERHFHLDSMAEETLALYRQCLAG